MKYPIALYALIISVSLNGCATVFHGTSQKISVNSVPSGASISVAGVSHGNTTPADIYIERGNNCTVRIEKDGYEPAEIALTNKLDALVVGDFITIPIAIGIVGVMEDFSNGAAYHFRVNPILS